MKLLQAFLVALACFGLVVTFAAIFGAVGLSVGLGGFVCLVVGSVSLYLMGSYTIEYDDFYLP